MSAIKFNLARLSDMLKMWRNMHNLTVAEMAELCGMAKSTYGFVESGDRCPSLAEYANICDLTDMPIGRFFKRE